MRLLREKGTNTVAGFWLLCPVQCKRVEMADQRMKEGDKRIPFILKARIKFEMKKGETK
jgi:hypothetical protein